MDIVAIIVVILIPLVIWFVLIKSAATKDQSGGAVSCGVNINPVDASPKIKRQICEIRNVNNFLNRGLLPVDEDIENLQKANGALTLPDGSPRVEAECQPCSWMFRELNFEDIDCDDVSSDQKTLVESKQPFFLESPYVIRYYGKNHYFDSRYPRKPIHVSFLEDEDKFVREHPQVYPSYVITSRNYEKLEPSPKSL